MPKAHFALCEINFEIFQSIRSPQTTPWRNPSIKSHHPCPAALPPSTANYFRGGIFGHLSRIISRVVSPSSHPHICCRAILVRKYVFSSWWPHAWTKSVGKIIINKGTCKIGERNDDYTFVQTITKYHLSYTLVSIWLLRSCGLSNCIPFSVHIYERFDSSTSAPVMIPSFHSSRSNTGNGKVARWRQLSLLGGQH